MLRLIGLLLLLAGASAQLSENQRVLEIIGAANANGIVLDADFATQPTDTKAWTWLQSDPTDSTTTAALHQGLAKFTGSTTSWIDLTTATGPNSCGRTLGLFGGTTGWGASMNPPKIGTSVEMVVKFNAISNWAKPFDFNTGPGIDELTWTWDGDSDGIGRFLIEQYINASLVNVDYDKGAMEFFRPNLNEWYHLVQVMVPAGEQGQGTWYIYVNGNKIALSDAIQPGTSHTALQSANYPLRIPRPFQYIARSAWSADPYMQMTVDAIRVYDFKLEDEQVGRLALAYGLQNNAYVPLTPAANYQFPTPAEQSKWMVGGINFQPAYSLDFETNPTTAVGGSIGYEWLQTDPADSATEQAKHRGLVKLSGAATNFLDLMKATGPNSVGKVIPTLFTQSTGTGDANGWTIDMVVKPLAIQSWAKYFCIGSGPYYDANYIGWIGGDNLWEAASYNNIRDTLRPFNPGQVTFFRAPTLNRWTHLTWVIQPLSQTFPPANYSATWTLFVDGQRVSQSSTNTNYPLPVVRRQAYLAQSLWAADANARMVLDAFRVWDRALNADQIEAISDAYGISAVDGGDFAWQTALGSSRAPVYNLMLQTNPTQNAGQAPVSWQWSEQDPTDATVVSGLHTGLALLSGQATSFIDLNAATGPNRVPDAITLPATIGGPTNPGGGLLSGWTFEIIVKATAVANWGKLFVISNGSDRDETIIGFDGEGGNLIVQNYIEDAVFDGRWAYSASEIIRPFVLRKWYHIVLTMAPGTTEGAGNWQIYVNGQLQDWASPIRAGYTYVEAQGASFPRGVPRPNSFLGKSTWNDPTSQLVIDAFRIYDYVITPQQVTAYSQAYGCYEQIPVPTPSNNAALPGSAETTNWQTAGLTRAPVFNGVFAENPASFVGGRTDYQWMAFDATDSAENQQKHRGIISFNGSDAAWADLTVATGSKSVGLVMPIIGGAGFGTGAARGITIEFVCKLTAIETWAKLIQFSTGPELDSLAIGWNNDRYNTIEVASFNRVRPGGQRVGAVDLFHEPPLNQWLFITLVMQLTDDQLYKGSWVAYESGVEIARHDSTAATNPANFPLPIYRPYVTIAKSSWVDPTATMLVDMYRVHDYAFTQAQVRQSVQAYGMDGSTRPPPAPTNVTIPFDQTDESRRAAAIVSKQPIFNAWFGTNPQSRVVNPMAWDYSWLEFDPADSPRDQQSHRGLIKLDGITNFIDVNTNSGPNSVGVVCPTIGGAGSGTGASAGWTFEIVLKIQTMTSWVKIFNFGNGPEINNILLGVDGTDSQTLAFELFDREQTTWPHGFAEVFQPEMNRWYHIVVQVAPTSNTTNGSAVWYFFVNGQKLAYSNAIWSGTSFTPIQGANYPKYVKRRNSYIGKSNWNDPTFPGLVDAFRVYDYRITESEISQLAEMYGLKDTVSILPSPSDNNRNVNPSSSAEVRAWDHDGIVEPVFNANFGTDPRVAIGGALTSFDYSWMERDPADSSADQNAHKGLIYLNGNQTSFINLAKATGSTSVGLVLPTLFASNGEGPDRGWTVELVAKVHRAEDWSKLINFGTGGSDWMDSFAITWNLDSKPDRTAWSVQNYNNLNPVAGQPNEVNNTDIVKPVQLSKWYHLAVVMQPYGPADRFAARWKFYVDGNLVLTTDAQMPLPVIRENSFIGASQWGSQDPKSQMTVDALRIYGKGLTSAQIASLARMYGHTPSAPPAETPLPPVLPPLDPNNFPGSAIDPGNAGSSSSKSSLSGGAIAGIVIGSIVGAVLLCVILFCLCAGGRRFGGTSKSTSDPDQHKGEGKYGQMEHSQQSHVNDDEIEMGETA